MPLTSHTNFRLRGIPLIYETKASIRQLVKQTLDLNPTTIISIHSVAVSPSDNTSKIATVSFPEIPACLSDKSRNEWPFHLKDGEDLDLSSSIVFDTHFRGFTPFQRASPEDCHVDIIAVTGLGGHALGSFKQKNGPFVWLRDALPVDAPNMRILSYGYDTTIINSRSFQNITDLARSLQLDLEGIQDSSHPRSIVFIAHSLGGLLVKETIVQMSHEPFPSGRCMLDHISAFMFFGVPHQGLAVECLVPMIKDSPNRALLESLGKNSPLLSRLHREFNTAIGTGCRPVISFYETEKSFTAQEVHAGKWEMTGPSEVLVEVSSANFGSLRQYPINRNHSEMVKFSSRQDDLYQRVVLALKPLLAGCQSLQNLGETRVGHSSIEPLSEDESSCLRSLSFQEQDHRYAELHYDKGTCEWLLEDSQYKTWLNAPRGLFWIKGSPGTGKSVLMRFAVEAMQRRQSTDLVRSFFIHGRGVLLQRTPLGVFRALLSFLLESFPAHLKELTQLFKHREERFGTYERRNGWTWTEAELKGILSKVLTQGTEARPVTIYVDALDECGEHDAKRLLQYFSDIMSTVEEEQGLLKICLSSRHYPILGLETMPSLTVEERNGKDIKLVVESRLKTLNLHEKRHQIENDILFKARGGFQWAILTTDIIRNGILRGLNSASLHQAVTTIPKDLEKIYDFILNDAKGEEKAHMVKLFQWVLFAERPLSAHELREALTTSQDMTFRTTSQLRDHQNYSDTVSDFEIRVRYISRGLVEFQSREVWEIYQTDGEDWDREAQFIHQSAADFVQQKFLVDVDFGPDVHSVDGMAHFEISRSCLKYMVLENILGSSQLSRRELSVKFPLLPYAITFLLVHIDLVERSRMTQADLLELVQWHQPDRLRKFSALWLTMDPDHSHAPMGWPFVGATAPHILVGLGSLSALQEYLTRHTVNLNAKDSDGNNPLLLALKSDREDLALFLIDQSAALQADQRSLVRDAPQTRQLEEETKSLSHVNTTDSDGETPLGVAMMAKASRAVLSLLRAGADPTAERGLLFYAINNLDKPLLAYLIEGQIEVELDGAVFFTVHSLRVLIQSDHETAVCEILSTLLDAGANTRKLPGLQEQFSIENCDDQDDQDQDEEVIIFASRYGLTSVVKLLIMHGVSPTLRNINGHCPLQVATECDHSEILEVLFEASLVTGELVKGEIEDIFSHAIYQMKNKAATVLLGKLYRGGIPLDVLTKCVMHGNVELAQIVLQPENKIESTTDNWLELTLWLALDVYGGSYKMMELLLTTREVDLSIESDDCKTLLRRCLSRGRRDLVRLILNTGKVDIHKDDDDNESPFWWTMREGSNGVIELLLGLDESNIHIQDSLGLTAYWWLTEGRSYERGRVAIAEAALYGNPFYDPCDAHTP